MEVRIEKKGPFSVAGYMEGPDMELDFPGVWDRLFQTAEPSFLSTLGDGRSYGVCVDMDEEMGMTYMAGYDVSESNKNKAIEAGLRILHLDEADYAVLEVVGAIPTSIHKGWQYFFEEYHPESRYEAGYGPSLEVYSEGDMTSKDYRMEIWIPVTGK